MMILEKHTINSIIEENSELVAIIVSSIKTAKKTKK